MSKGNLFNIPVISFNALGRKFAAVCRPKLASFPPQWIELAQPEEYQQLRDEHDFSSTMHFTGYGWKSRKVYHECTNKESIRHSNGSGNYIT